MRDTAIRAAKAASKIQLENLGKISAGQIDTKKQFDFVTFVDKTSESTIIETIRTEFPDHQFYGEESHKEEGGGHRWIIDPLDGTTNYIHGIPFFSISIALEVEHEIVLGVVYDPVRDEMFVAEKGKGTTLNDQPVRVSAITDPAVSLITTGFPFRAKEYIDIYQRSFKDILFQASGVRRMGSAALDFSYIACGRSEGFWEIKLGPWDVAAGSLLVREAGGVITDFSGGDEYIWTGNVVASNGHLHDMLLGSVQKVFAGTIDK